MSRTITALTTIMLLTTAACGDVATAGTVVEPAVVETVPGSDVSRLILTERAAQRLDITLAGVAEDEGRLVVPSAAVIIDSTGRYWVYEATDPFEFGRVELSGAWEEGTQTYFEEGPPVGTDVVVVGVPELYGTEFGIGK